LGELPYW